MAVPPTLVAGRLKQAILDDMADDLQPYVDDAEAAAVTAVGAAAYFKEVASWSRPVVAAGQYARIYDVNLQRAVEYRGGQWYDDDGIARPTPNNLYSLTAANPAFLVGTVRNDKSGYTGPLFRVCLTATPATFADVSSAAEVRAFAKTNNVAINDVEITNSKGRDFYSSGVSVVGLYDQVSGTLLRIGSSGVPGGNGSPAPQPYVEKDGIGTYYTNSASDTAGLIVNVASGAGTATSKDLFRNRPGFTIHMTLWYPRPWTTSNSTSGFYPFLVTNNVSASQARHGVRLIYNTGGIQTAGRRLDADTAQTRIEFAINSGFRTITNVQDNANAIERLAIDGVDFGTKVLQTAGNTSDTTPTNLQFGAPRYAGVVEMAIYNTAATASEFDAMRGDAIALLNAHRNNQDAWVSWWCNPTLKTRRGTVLFGYSTAQTHFAVDEYDPATGDVIGTKVLERDTFTADEHNEVTLHELDDGALVAFCTGHSNAIAPATNGRIAIYYSASGQIADLTGPTLVTSSFTAINYGQAFESSSKFAFMTNDDSGNQWALVKFTDKAYGSGVQCRPFINTTGTPAQLYVRSAQISRTTLRCATMLHATVLGSAQNAIRLFDLDIESGQITAGSGFTAIDAYATSGSATPWASYPAIYTPASGYSVRIFDVSPEGDAIAFAEFQLSSVAATTTHYVLVWDGVNDKFLSTSWTKRQLSVTVGDPYNFDTTRAYMQPAVFAKEDRRSLGLRLYRGYKSGTDYIVEMCESANRGVSWKRTELYRSTRIVARLWATGDEDFPAIANRCDSYTSYTNLKGAMVPIPAAQ